MRRRTARDLSALADGSLPAERRDALLRRIAASPRLARALEQQRFAVDVVRGLTPPAPTALRAWVRQAVREAAATRRSRRDGR
jgi:anti-sigma factor RsiW